MLSFSHFPLVFLDFLTRWPFSQLSLSRVSCFPDVCFPDVCFQRSVPDTFVCQMSVIHCAPFQIYSVSCLRFHIIMFQFVIIIFVLSVSPFYMYSVRCSALFFILELVHKLPFHNFMALSNSTYHMPHVQRFLFIVSLFMFPRHLFVSCFSSQISLTSNIR